MSLVEIGSLSKTYGSGDAAVHALASVSFTIEDGEFISIVGPSGCGKTTLLEILAGLITPTSGAIEMRSINASSRATSVGMMFQNAVLLDWRTILQNVLLPLEIRDGRRAARSAQDRAKSLIDLVGLTGFEHRYPSELSGGMQQRAAICRMLIADPALLLLDEPFSALDEFTREYMNIELARIVYEARKTAVFVTHNIQESVFLADRVLVMRPRPAKVVGIVDIDIERPRSLRILTGVDFQSKVKAVRDLLSLDTETVKHVAEDDSSYRSP